MKKERISPAVYVPNIVCVILFIAMVAVMFLPTWQHGDGMLSMASYVGFPTKQATILRSFKDALGLAKTPSVNDVVTAPVCIMLLSVVGLLVAALFKKAPVSSLVALFTGIFGVISYTTNPFLGLAQTKLVLIIVSAATAVAGLVGIVLYIIMLVKNEKAQKAAQ